MATVVKDEMMWIPLKKIKLSTNSRMDIREEEIHGMMQSIRETGLLEPIGVIKEAVGGGYEIAYGNRRYLACSKLGWTTIPAMIKKSEEDGDLELMNLAENIQRRQLSLVEVGRYIALLRTKGLSNKECSIRLGVSVEYVRDCLNTFERVPEEYKNKIEIRTGHTKKGAEVKPGNVSVKQAVAILGVSKKVGATALRKDEELALFKAAKLHGSKFRPEKVREYLANVRAGKDPLDQTVLSKDIHIICQVSEAEYKRLETKHILNGAFRSMSALMRAIIKGEVVERIKILDQDHLKE